MTDTTTAGTKRRKRQLPKPLEPDEVRRILAVPNRKTPTGCRNYVALALMAEAGLRVGEVCSLLTSDYTPAKGNDPARLRINGGKGGDRVVFLTDGGAARLNEWLQMRARYAPKTSKVMFCQVRTSAWRDPQAKTEAKLAGTPLTTSYFRSLCLRLGKEAGVEHTHPHRMRHSAAILMLDQEYPLPDIQAQLGHKNLATTSVYLSVSDARRAARVKASSGLGEDV